MEETFPLTGTVTGKVVCVRSSTLNLCWIEVLVLVRELSIGIGVCNLGLEGSFYVGPMAPGQVAMGWDCDR